MIVSSRMGPTKESAASNSKFKKNFIVTDSDNHMAVVVPPIRCQSHKLFRNIKNLKYNGTKVYWDLPGSNFSANLDSYNPNYGMDISDIK